MNYARDIKKTVDEKLRKALNELADELNVKLTYSQTLKGEPAGLISVIVQTLKDDQEIGGYEVWYVTKGWADSKDHYQRFDTLSSPAIKDLPPGNYFIWTQKGIVKTEQQPFTFGTDGISKREIQITVH